MKNLIRAVLISCALSAPVVAFAQNTNGPVTRAEVRADPARVERAGYRPIGNDPFYPSDNQAAEAKVAAQRPDASPAQSHAVASQSDAQRAAVSYASNDTSGLYEHHRAHLARLGRHALHGGRTHASTPRGRPHADGPRAAMRAVAARAQRWSSG
ncbi:hypothetical protein BvRS1_38960 [Burkholderia vietnamiensis]|nr:hypothetical protein BvRS1_38960 [Burkholderia vietnamiensis]